MTEDELKKTPEWKACERAREDMFGAVRRYLIALATMYANTADPKDPGRTITRKEAAREAAEDTSTLLSEMGEGLVTAAMAAFPEGSG